MLFKIKNKRCLIKNGRHQAVEKTYIYGLMADLGLMMIGGRKKRLSKNIKTDSVDYT